MRGRRPTMATGWLALACVTLLQVLAAASAAAQAQPRVEAVPPAAHPGETVLVRAAGPVIPAGSRRIQVLLAPAAELSSATDSPPRLVPLGYLSMQPSGAAELRARVPDLPAGSYRLVVFLPDVRPAYWPAGELQILPGEAIARASPAWRVAAGAFTIILVGTLIAMAGARLARLVRA